MYSYHIILYQVSWVLLVCSTGVLLYLMIAYRKYHDTGDVVFWCYVIQVFTIIFVIILIAYY